MDIASLEIRNLFASGFREDMEGVEHIKSLPCLSVVQALHGRYEIALDGAGMQMTAEGGVFVAPAGSMQRIVHHNGSGGTMEAQWVFMNVTVNGVADLCDVLEFPLILPEEDNARIARLIGEFRGAGSLCGRYAAAYGIVDVLLAAARPKAETDGAAARIREYVAEHFRERITKEDLARHAFCSVPHLYRLFRKHFAATPANYINQVRLQNAAVWLESSRLPVSRIAEMAGFDDAAYFAKLFRRCYAVSPSRYREQNFHAGAAKMVDTEA